MPRSRRAPRAPRFLVLLFAVLWCYCLSFAVRQCRLDFFVFFARARPFVVLRTRAPVWVAFVVSPRASVARRGARAARACGCRFAPQHLNPVPAIYKSSADILEKRKGIDAAELEGYKQVLCSVLSLKTRLVVRL